MPEPDANPYAPPVADLELSPRETRGCWRQGRNLVVLRGFENELPSAICVRCGEPAQQIKQREFHWVPAWYWAAIIPMGLLWFSAADGLMVPFLYGVAGLLLKRSMSLPVGECREHRKRRLLWTASSMVLMTAGAALVFRLVHAWQGDKQLVAGLCLVAAAFCAFTRASYLLPVARRIDSEAGRFGGLSKAWLDQLPPFRKVPRT